MSSAVPRVLQRGPGLVSHGADKHMIVPKEQTATLRKNIQRRPPRVKIPRRARGRSISMS